MDDNECTPCLAGMYCDSPGLVAPRGPCRAGHFCLSGATSPAPVSQMGAGECPSGSYCPFGSSAPIPCPVGTFSNITGLRNISECIPCSPGYFCQSLGLTLPEGICASGFYCPLRSSNSQQEICPEGFFCPEGSSHPYPCPVGTFSNLTHITSALECLLCTAGFYCQIEALTSPSGPCSEGFYCPIGSQSPRPKICNIGHYCPLGSEAPLPCSGATYSDNMQESECRLCPSGWYCDAGLIVDLCPAGHFCLEGISFDWSPCPIGTFSNVTGLGSVDECTPCSPGHFCGEIAATEPTDQCDAGHFCIIANIISNPVSSNASNFSSCLVNNFIGGSCPAGYFCPVGTSEPVPCHPGSYTPSSGYSECLSCAAGYYCLAGSDDFLSQVCPPGHYCSAGTRLITQYPCPVGTFSNTPGLTNESQCEQCLPGMYCSSPGLTTPSGSCSAGWYCDGGAVTPAPNSLGQGRGSCLQGFFCPEGSAPVPCNNGSYCDQPFLSIPTGPCAPGYFCTSGSDTATPTDGSLFGGVCPEGHYCPSGSWYPLQCPAGTFSNSTGNTEV